MSSPQTANTKNGQLSLPISFSFLFFHDLQDFHRTSLDADAAGDALGNGRAFLMYHDLHGTHSHTSAAANAQLLIDHVNAGLGILCDGAMLTSLHALAALDAHIGLCATVLSGNDLDAGIIGIEFLIECFGASLDTLQASHALGVLLNSQFLHRKNIRSFSVITYLLYIEFKK